jgi:hypothetical protein
MTRFERDALPCPFCGGRAKQVPGECILVCTGCYAKAIDSRWNLRDTFPQPPSDQGLRESAVRAVNAFCALAEKHAEECECDICEEASDAFHRLACAATGDAALEEWRKG